MNDRFLKIPNYPDLLSEIQPALLAFAAMIFGFIMLATSFMIGIGQVTVRMPDQGVTAVKEVGYGSALNWSIVLCLLLPAALLYLCKAYRLFPLVLRDLTVSRMAVSAELQPVTHDQLSDLWQQDLKRYKRPLSILTGVGFLFSIWEWSTNSLMPLLARDPSTAPEIDWSIGVLFDQLGQRLHPGIGQLLQNSAFSFIAFLAQGVIIAALLTFLYMALIVGTFVTDLSRPDGTFRLLPDLNSKDDRLGFEAFGSFIETSLVFVGIAYTIFYLSRLQNIYLRSKDTSIIDFIVQQLIQGIVKNPLDLGAKGEIFKQAVDHTAGLDYSSLMVALGAFAVLLISVFMIFSTVREAAVRSRDELRRCLMEDPERTLQLSGLTRERAEAKLARMVFWPVRYIRAREFFAAVFIGAICIVFYKLAMVLLGLLMFRLFWDITRYITGLPESKIRTKASDSEDAPAASGDGT